MARVQNEDGDRYSDVDIESILARVERRGPLTLARKRSLYRAPEFVKRLAQEITVDEGSTVCFECKVVAFPNPTITWTKDFKALPDDSRFQTESTDNGVYTLTINEATKKDEATYRCQAENVEGSSSSTIYLAVKALKKDKPKKSSGGVLAHAQTFPVIKEEVEEEEAEEEYFRNQPDSPLTSLYCGIKWKNRTWPDFLYDKSFAVNYYDYDLESMDTDEDDVFLSEPGNDKQVGFPDFQDNSDSDSEMANIIKQNLIFENRNFTNSFTEKANGSCRIDQDLNANTYTDTCTSILKQNGDVPHFMKSLHEISENITDNAVLSWQANPSVVPTFSDVTGMNLAVLVFLLSGYTFLALRWNMDPRTFVCFELFVEFLFLIVSSLLD
ncbi:uncharacterized protein LOC133191163 isoform X2 [Saccostrea echinata]|uniref:uncharacterized protein LOC133191163 isoform X2 n=1 Tax=Saccostrea echinata TaxID=191078 RepID=UPI002A83D976|nr:uncharacterized protein LOC133191163 isoform X2 [Saccostrea echinata]